ncbi:MAG: AAA family ATPase, partial [Myxococcota bacterium]
QRTLIRALKATFPRIQFVATTHSPLALSGLRPDRDEIVCLELSRETGDVHVRDIRRSQHHEPDPRLMTGSELYRSYFGIDRFYPHQLGRWLEEHRYLAADPGRSDADEARLDELETSLREEGVEPDFPREPRSES